MREERGAIVFAERVLELLDDGQYTATYKYAASKRPTSGGHLPTSEAARRLAGRDLPGALIHR